jgi:chemotaxis protein MotB
MMAFFIVMWILASSEEVKQSVADYASNPMEYSVFTGKKTGDVPVAIDIGMKQSKTGSDDEEGNNKNSSNVMFFDFSDKKKSDYEIPERVMQAMQDSAVAAQRVGEVSDEIEEMIDNMISDRPDMKEILSSIKIEMTEEGLRIELIETTESLFFNIGSASLTKEAVDVLKQLASEIGKLPNNVEIEGHTDARGYSPDSNYDNWNLSTDRAISASRILNQYGLWQGQVESITGYADRKLRNPDNPFDVVNRRVSIIVKHLKVNQFIPNIGENNE